MPYESGLENMVNHVENKKQVTSCPSCGGKIKRIETKFNTQFMCLEPVKECKTILFGVKSDIARQM